MVAEIAELRCIGDFVCLVP